MPDTIKLVECPRDAMQGWKNFIPTAQKVAYLNQLLRVGFDVLDFGSFVSAKAIPQLADTADVLAQLNIDDSATKLLAIIANTRGAQDAAQHAAISYLGFPFSISETFQLRNTNKTIVQSFLQVLEMQDICAQCGKELVIYISMGFGNPYGDPYDPETALHWVEKLTGAGVRTIALSDTVGLAQPNTIHQLFRTLIPAFPGVEIGAHFHAAPDSWMEKVQVAYDAGCRRFDSALKGIGGCPMAEDELVGNIATENLVWWAEQQGIPLQLNKKAFFEALSEAAGIFSA